MTVLIRPAQPADIPVIADLIRRLARFEKLEDQVKLTEELLAAGLFGVRPYAESVLAEVDGRPVGFALFFHNFSTFLARPGLFLEDLFVLPEHRGLGIGRTLLTYLARLAVERGCGRLEWSVLDWNKEAISFYERLGARANSEWTTYRIAGEALHRLAREK
jgi:GNAT superfamily N-acetyltransferase